MFDEFDPIAFDVHYGEEKPIPSVDDERTDDEDGE